MTYNSKGVFIIVPAACALWVGHGCAPYFHVHFRTCSDGTVPLWAMATPVAKENESMANQVLALKAATGK